MLEIFQRCAWNPGSMVVWLNGNEMTGRESEMGQVFSSSSVVFRG